MVRQVLREIRFHPGRFVATLVAIAISVAFMAGSSVLVATEQNSLERLQSLPVAGADIVITLSRSSQATAVKQTLSQTAGVAAYEPSLTASLDLKRGSVVKLMNVIGLPSEPFRWSKVQSGRWPQAPGEVVVAAGVASSLGVGIGDTLTSGPDATAYRVVGLTGEPNSLFVETAYVSPADLVPAGHEPEEASVVWMVRAAPGTQVNTLVSSLRTALAEQSDLKVESAAESRAAAVRELSASFDAFRNLLWAFAAIAAVVGMITIANTFTILLAQRRRQIGLLRAVGASGSQVRQRFLIEALGLGVIGAAAGIGFGIGLAALGSMFTGSLYWGLALPTPDLVVAFLAGILITVVAAFVPVLRGTRVRPLEALQPEPSGEERRRASLVRGVVCGLLIVGGLAMALLGLGNEQSLLFAIGGSVLIAFGVLFGAVLFVPGLLRLLGAVSGRSVTARLAAQNSVRNPRRAATTATALMLAVGLIVTLQVGTATIRATVLDQLDARRPVDLSVGMLDITKPLPADLPAKALKAPGVTDGVVLPVTNANFVRKSEHFDDLTVLGFVPGVEKVASAGVSKLADDQVLVWTGSSSARDGEQIKLVGRHATVTLTVHKSKLVESGEVMVSQATIERLGAVVPQGRLWLSVPNRSDAIAAAGAVSALADESMSVKGGVLDAAAIESVLSILLTITTALLGVAVLIALIGVSNTLGLSVLERTRESALLRALGLQARSLRTMLLVEALLLAAVGVGVGVLAGIFFGWLGAQAIANPLEAGAVTLQVDYGQTLAMVAVAIVAAALASVLPGRRAAKASPTEALADI